jgi:hypothetical protein
LLTDYYPPQIVPKLVECGSDPHPKVKESVKLAMSDISAVIRNPEIARLSPVLLAALADPGAPMILLLHLHHY